MKKLVIFLTFISLLLSCSYSHAYNKNTRTEDPRFWINGRDPRMIMPTYETANGITTNAGKMSTTGYYCPACRKAQVAGTDLAASWDDGNGGTYMAFGDTVDYKMQKKTMRAPTLAHSNKQFENGFIIDNFYTDSKGHFRSIFSWGPGNQFNPMKKGFERSRITTGGFSYNGRQYLGWEGVYKDVSSRVQFTSKRSGLAVSDPNGKNWKNIFFRNQPAYKNFQQVSFVKKGNMLFEFGTAEGHRQNGISIARVPLNQLTNLAAREYWDGTNWIKNNPAAARPVFANLRNANIKNPKPYGAFGGISIQFDNIAQKFMMMWIWDNMVILSWSSDGVHWSCRQSKKIYSFINPKNPKLQKHLVDKWMLYSPQMLPNQNGPIKYFQISSWKDYNNRTLRTTMGAPINQVENKNLPETCLGGDPDNDPMSSLSNLGSVNSISLLNSISSAS